METLGSPFTPDRQLMLLSSFTENWLYADKHKKLEENNLLYPC